MKINEILINDGFPKCTKKLKYVFNKKKKLCFYRTPV